MLSRIARWLEETHGVQFELVRHFLARFFDSEIVANSGDWLKVVVGVLAMLLSVAILGVRTYVRRYTDVMFFSTPEAYREMVRSDLLSFLSLAMVVTALLTLVLWQSLFPSARDCLALAGLPVGARQIFRAKFSALLLLFGAYTAALTAIPAALFTAVTGCKWQEHPSGLVIGAAHFASLACACIFIFFGLLAVQGLLLNLLPARAFGRVSLGVQSALFIASLSALPLLGRQPRSADWWPPLWFLGLWESIVTGRAGAGRTAVLATALLPLLAVLAYLVSYHRYRRLLLEAQREHSERRTRAAAWLLEHWIARPREQAAFAFLWKTLARSRTHRLVLLAYAGIALGSIIDAALESPGPSLRDEGLYGLFAVLAPLGLSMLATVGLRYVFSLPVSLQANWVFRTLDADGRAAWLAAVERFVVWLAIVPIFLVSLPAAVTVLGGVRAAGATVLTLLGALVWFEVLFRKWSKLPFTCSYLPGKKPVLFTVARYLIAVPLLGPAGQLVLYGSRDLAVFMALFTLLGITWWRLRVKRVQFWAGCALRYEETPDAAVLTLDLPAGETAPAASSRTPTAVPLFAASLVASRNRIAEAWADEFEEGRRRPWRLLETVWEDVRYGVRLIRRNPLFSTVVALTLTVGIGINASVFTLANGLAFRPHVYHDAASFLRVIPRVRMQNTVRRFSYAEYVAYRDSSRTLSQLGAWANFPVFLGQDNSAGAVGMAVSCNFFQVDGAAHALLGRLFVPDDCRLAAGEPVVLIAERFWRARLGADPRVVGRSIEVNGRPATIAGVVRDRTASWTRSLFWSRPPSVWVPFTSQAFFEQPGAKLYGNDELWLSVAGRLAPGYSRGQARAELNVLARRIERIHAGRETDIDTTDGSWIAELERSASGGQLMLMAFFVGAFNLVLLVACANVATLLLARAAARRREIAIRLSLGAPRIRLVRMLITEGLLLAAMAGAVSAYLCWRLPAPLYRILSGRAPDFPMAPDWRTFTHLAVVVVLTGVLAGLAPALASVKVSLTDALKGGVEAGRFAAGTTPRMQGLLVSAQVALSMVLLVAAAVFARAEDRTLRSDPGFLPGKVVVAPLYFSDETTVSRAATRLATIAHRVQAIPGVRSVAFSEGMPLFDHATVELRPPRRPDAQQTVDVFSASPGFFATLGIPLARGREFQLFETSAVVVSQRLARLFWPRQDPLGQALSLPGGFTATVVGVVRDVDPMRFGGSENPALYRPWRLTPVRNVLSVRFDAGEASGAASVRAAVREAVPELLVFACLAQAWIDQLTEDLWNVVALILFLGIIAVVLATAGIYGAVSFAVAQRTKEMGIRMALGAGKLAIVREIVLAGGKPVAKGLLAGLWLSVAVAAGLGRGFAGSPVRLDTASALPYAGAALLLTGAALAAMLAPARRGASTHPLDSLRVE